MKPEIEKIIYKKVEDILFKENPASEVTAETIIKDLQIDSLSILELIYELENQFNITLDEYELTSMDTVGDLIEMVRHSLKVEA